MKFDIDTTEQEQELKKTNDRIAVLRRDNVISLVVAAASMLFSFILIALIFLFKDIALAAPLFVPTALASYCLGNIYFHSKELETLGNKVETLHSHILIKTKAQIPVQGEYAGELQ